MLAEPTDSRAAAAYAALVEVERLAALLASAPQLTDRMTLAGMMAQRHARFRDVLDRYAAPDPQAGMASAAPALDDARRRVESGDWWEDLAVIALSAPLTDDLFAALTGDDANIDETADTADDAVIVPDSDTDADPGVSTRSGYAASDPAAQWAAERLRAALDDDPVLAARLALWGRRLVGEAVVLARIFGGPRYRELAETLAARHAERLEELGLAG